MKLDLFQNIKVIESEDKDPTKAKCCICNKWYKIEKLSGYWESESWELPQKYYVHECPKCDNGGCVCDYE